MNVKQTDTFIFVACLETINKVLTSCIDLFGFLSSRHTMLFEKFQNNPFAASVKCESQAENTYETSIVPGRQIAAAAGRSEVILPGDSCAFGSNKYFILCGLGGIISCGSTHTMVSEKFHSF